VILAVMLVMVRWLPATPIIAYAALFISSSILYLSICRDALRVEPSARGLIPLLLLLVLLRLGFLSMQPLGSDDVYRYMWDGRVQTAGINPYRYAPDDTALAHLHTAKLPLLVNHANLKTLYFPLSEWIFYLGYNLSGEHVWGFQLFILIAEALTLTGLLLLMREFSYSPWRVLLYAANPLIILQFSLDSHVDVFGFPFLIFGLLFYFRRRLTLALLLIGISLLVKPTALIILPILFFDQQGFTNRAKVAVLPLAVMLIPFIPYSFGVNPFEALTTFSKNWFFNGALFSLLLPIIPDNQTNRLICLGILAIALLFLYRSRKPLNDKLVLSALVLLLCSPVAHPWYMGWMIVLLPLAPVVSAIVLAATASLPSITFVTYQLQGVWKDYPLVLLVEYVPVVAFLLFYDLRQRGKRGRTSTEEN
jgi:alpha-1,6-mannosyltransferase